MGATNGLYGVSASNIFRFFVVTSAALAAVAIAAAAETDISRLQQQRSQQQMELQLKMQQQQERTSRGSPTTPGDAQLRRFEIEQQQRLQQFGDDQSRARAAASARDDAADRLRMDETKRPEPAPRINTDRSTAGAR